MASSRLPPLQPLAARIYRLLRRRTALRHATTTYSHLARLVGVSHRGPALDRALGQLVVRCQARNLPLIAALVVRADLGIPGPGYYPIAHGIAPRPRPAAALAWAREVARVCGHSYPPTI